MCAMDEYVLRQIKELHWNGLARRAAESGSETVGLMSGGPHLVSLELAHLAALGVEGWIEKLELGPENRPTFNVFIRTTDLPKLFDISPVMTPQQSAASEMDSAEHEARCRDERPWVELWWHERPVEFEGALRSRMTLGQARTIRDWVVENGPTWRAIAAMARGEFSEVWKMDWIPPGHQPVGYIVSDVASSFFGETASNPPWN